MTDKQKRDGLIDDIVTTSTVRGYYGGEAKIEYAGKNDIVEILTEYDTWLRGEMKQAVMMADVFDSASSEEIEEVSRAIDTAGKEKV